MFDPASNRDVDLCLIQDKAEVTLCRSPSSEGGRQVGVSAAPLYPRESLEHRTEIHVLQTLQSWGQGQELLCQLPLPESQGPEDVFN